MGPSAPGIFRGDFSPKGDHLCPKRKILPGSNYYCPEVILPICCCFPSVFSFVCFCLYLFLFDFYFFACLSVSNQVGQSVPKIFRDDFISWMGPSVSEILIGDFLPTWDHLCPKRKILTGDNYYCGEVILPICCCFHPFLIYIDIFNWLALFVLACRFFFSVFLFRCVPVRDFMRILCRIP